MSKSLCVLAVCLTVSTLVDSSTELKDREIINAIHANSKLTNLEQLAGKLLAPVSSDSALEVRQTLLDVRHILDHLLRQSEVNDDYCSSLSFQDEPEPFEAGDAAGLKTYIVENVNKREKVCSEVFLKALSRVLEEIWIEHGDDLKRFGKTVQVEDLNSSHSLWPKLVAFALRTSDDKSKPSPKELYALLGPMVKSCELLRNKLEPYMHIFAWLELPEELLRDDETEEVNYVRICMFVNKQFVMKLVQPRWDLIASSEMSSDTD